MTEYNIGDRLLIDDEFCTIRYIGSLEVWPTERAFGVEWDNSSRGKHSGTFKGHTYFQTETLGAGSFLKASKVKKAVRSSFFEAIKNTYGDSQDDTITTQFSSKIVEFVGFGDLNERNSKTQHLETLSLRRKNIATVRWFNQEHKDPYPIFTHLRTLDLSYNLFNDFGDVINVLDSMPILANLTLDGNMFSFPSTNVSPHNKYNNIRCLSLVNCHLNAQTLNLILQHFPRLTTLDISENYITEKCLETLELPKSLKTLSLRSSSLEHIPLNILTTSIEELDLSYNNITSMSTEDCAGNNNLNVCALDISHNSINSWDVLDNINDIFRKLKTLRVNSNTILGDDASEETVANGSSTFYATMARFSDLRVLNGSILTAELQEEAELFFVSEIKKGNTTLTVHSERWEYYKETYNIDQIAHTEIRNDFDAELGGALEVLHLTVYQKETDIATEIYVQPHETVRYMKGLIRKQMGLDVLSMTLSYSPSGSKGSIEMIKRDFSPISDLALESGSAIYVTDC